MHGFDLETEQLWSISSWFGIDHPFLKLNATTIIGTWVVLGIILLLSLGAYAILRYNHGVSKFMVISAVSFFIDLCNQSMGTFFFNHFCFITTLFLFIFLCNTVSLIPWIEEPTTDLNTTLALGIISFFYVQIVTIQYHGFLNYIKGYFTPIFVMFPLNVLGKLASIISISFRLFGNIFGGSIITNIYFSTIAGSIFAEIIGIFTLNFPIMLFFIVFEGFLQAFVFSMLSLTYLSLAIQGESGH